ncbi:MAG: hypothetical protein ACM3SM_14275 [Bacteroidota bacterium]
MKKIRNIFQLTGNAQVIILISGTLLLIAASVFIDFIVLKTSPLVETTPKFSPVYIMKSLLVLTASLLLIESILKVSRKHLQNSIKRIRLRLGRAAKFRLAVVFLISSGFIVLFIISPELFSALCREDQPVEMLSSILFFVCCAIFLEVFIMAVKFGRNQYFLIVSSAALLIIFFLIGMEEISWFQRVLGIDTPSAFAGNIQKEMNLHNYATNYVENAYYFSSFVFLVLIPFIFFRIPEIRSLGAVTLLIPGRTSLLAASVIMAYNYDMWNNVLIQFSFFASLLILCNIRNRARGRDRIIITSIIITLVITQVILLFNPEHIVRRWDATEYKEFFISLAFLIYSGGVYFRMKSSGLDCEVETLTAGSKTNP